MSQVDAEGLEAAAKKVREIRMSDGDSFGTLLYATDYCAGPTAGEALQQMHDLTRNIAQAAINAFTASLASRGMRVMPREPTEGMLYEMGQAANFHIPRDANRAMIWRVMFDSFANLNGEAQQTAFEQEQPQSPAKGDAS